MLINDEPSQKSEAGVNKQKIVALIWNIKVMTKKYKRFYGIVFVKDFASNTSVY